MDLGRRSQFSLEIFDLQLITELVEPQEIHPRTEAAGLGGHHKPWELGRRLLSMEPPAEHVIDNLFEALAAAASQLLELSGDILVESEGGTYAGIMMSRLGFVKMLRVTSASVLTFPCGETQRARYEASRPRLPQGEPSMIGRIARPLSFALLAAFLAFPLAAQPAAPESRGPSVLEQIWERLAAPALSLFASGDTDGRSIWDPNGLAVQAPELPENIENDGRGIWDPNG